MFLIAGFDTTASATVCFAYRLACNPEIQQRLFDEINAFISTEVSIASSTHAPQDEVTFDVIHKMTFLDWCTREALRIDPLVARCAYARFMLSTVASSALTHAVACARRTWPTADSPSTTAFAYRRTSFQSISTRTSGAQTPISTVPTGTAHPESGAMIQMGSVNHRKAPSPRMDAIWSRAETVCGHAFRVA
jgi:hypothetical protein